MENLVTETVADQGLTVSAEDDTKLVSALPTNDAEEVVVLEELTKNTVDAEPPQADVIADLAHGIESLTKDDACARLLELEEDQEKTFFEIGGVLSAIQKHKWFEPFGSLDEWVKKNTAIKRSRARAWIQIYDAVVKSGVTWAKVKHLGWTKLNAIAGVLDGENADHWIGMASNHIRPEIKKLVQQHLVGSVASSVLADHRLIARASKSSSRLDAPEIVQPAGRRFSRGDRPERSGPARAVIGRAEEIDCRVDLAGGFR